MTFLPRRALPILLAPFIGLVACGDDGQDNVSEDEIGGEEFDSGDGDGEGVSTAGEEGTSDSGVGDEAAGDDGGGDPSGGDGDGDGTGDGGIEPGQLTAGEWRDLDHWDFWSNLFAPESDWAGQALRWGMTAPSLRIPVVVVADNEPAIDVEVVLRDAQDNIRWRTRTDNLGRAELWPGLFGAAVEAPLTISAQGQSLEVAELPGALTDPFILALDSLPAAPDNLDLMLVVDTTGSMSDELSYLTVELGDVISQVDQELGGDVDMRMSVNFYRDFGDEYVVESNPFTTDVAEVVAQLAAQSAEGGGDFPEAVDVALQDAIYEHQWSTSARARLLFLVLDAPPHDTPSIQALLHETIEDAAAMGIRVIPVAASGIDKDTEFLLRKLDIATGATYTFLTSHSGIGGPHLEPTVGEYEVELLNELLVRLIVDAML